MTSQQITVGTTIEAPIQHVWEAYTTPADITRWNFASDDWCCPSAESDLKVGGIYKARMEAKDGSFGFDFEAVYREVEPCKAIALAMSDGRNLRTTFEAAGEGTKVTTVFDAETQNSMEMQRYGWQVILDNFGAYVQK